MRGFLYARFSLCAVFDVAGQRSLAVPGTAVATMDWLRSHRSRGVADSNRHDRVLRGEPITLDPVVAVGPPGRRRGVTDDVRGVREEGRQCTHNTKGAGVARRPGGALRPLARP